jgi:hypothetical protein
MNMSLTLRRIKIKEAVFENEDADNTRNHEKWFQLG